MKWFSKFPLFILSPITTKPLLFCILVLLQTLPGWLYCLMAYKDYPPIRMTAWLIFMTALPFLLSWIVCRINRKFVTIIVLTIGVIFFAINLFLILNFTSMISPWILLLCHETNNTESAEFISKYIITRKSIFCYLTVFLAVIAVIAAVKSRYKIKVISPVFITIITLICLITGIIQLVLVGQIVRCKTQFELQNWYEGKAFYCIENTFSNLFYSSYHLYVTSKENNKTIAVCQKAWNTKAYCSNNDSIDLVVIIGESFSKHHASLYNYQLNTTPHLVKEKENGNLFAFNDVITPYNMTTLAVKNILSTNSISLGQYWTDYPPFTIIFHKAGYDVAMWDNQKATGNVTFHDFSISSYLYSNQMIALAYNHINNDIYDYDMQLICNTINTKRNNKHTLTIYHLLGQHAQAKWRYPDTQENNIFSEKDINRPDLNKEKKDAIAEYDNATRYNDLVVLKIFDYYRHRCAVVVYLSDHGEEVYDYRDVIGRTHEPEKNKMTLKYQYQIPFMIWCSNNYKQQYPELITSLEKAVNRPFTSDNLSHLLFTLGFVKSPYYNRKKDILNNQYQCGKRRVQDHTDYDMIISSAPASSE